MSSAGQVVGGVVGAVAGFFVGGPTGALYGAQIGMMAGGYLDPPKGPTLNGPRLDDLSIQTSTYGAVIPRVYGTVTVNGNVFWLENNALKETITKKKSGGKGGGSKTTTRTYTYSATFAVGLCKGPIAGVRRIWIGPDLIYDAGSSDPATITASNDAAVGFQVYAGTDTQLPDDRMQATLGAANTPAWRGLAYVVFYDLQLARYANSLAGAQVRVEVMTIGATDEYVATQRDMPTSRQWACVAYGNGLFVALANNGSFCCVSADGITWDEYATPAVTAWQAIAFGNGVFVAVADTSNVYSSPDGITWTSHAAGSGWHTGVAWNGSMFLCVTDSMEFQTSLDGRTWTSQTAPASGAFYGPWWNGSLWITVQSGTPNKIWTSPSAAAGTWTFRQDLTGGDWRCGTALNGVVCLGSSGGSGLQTSSDGITWTPNAGISGDIYGMDTDGLVFLASVNGGSFYTSTDGATWTTRSMPASRIWYAAAWSGAHFVVTSNSSHPVTIPRLFVSSIFPTLDDVVSAECMLSGILTGADIDVTDLTQEVRGYRVGSVGALRAAIEPLQAAWPFDVVQHGYVIRFVARGGSSVVTIPAADLDARSSGQQPGVQITVSREMDSQLPRRVTIKHLDYDREYETGAQYAERLNTEAINSRILDLPIVLTSDEAAGKAEVLLYLYWLERYDVAINLPPTYNQVEPGDVVTLVTPEGHVSLRLTAIAYTSDGRVECKAKYNSAAIYTPTAVAASPAVTGPTTITPVGAAVYALLDLPLVSSAQAGPSFLAAMTGALAGWQGGVLMQSIDAGATWASLHDFGAPGADMGTCSNSIGAVESRMLDSASALSVTMTQGELFSVTQLAMLAGGNHFAYGADGRWEIIAAQDCTLISGTTYTLTNLLRGRFGTEWAMGMHAVGDALILLDTADVASITMSAGSIGLPYLYRGITIDMDIGTDGSRSFAYQGVNLKPLAPVYFCGYSDPYSGDWSLSWVRRTRTGGEWRDNVDADLGESSEAYEIDVFADDTYATVKRTITATSPAASYTSAQQVTDFGAAQTDIYLKIYQVSAVVGRGYGLTCSATATIADGYSATITVPAASVSASLTAFPLFIDLSQMSSAWWSAVWYSDGRDIRALNDAGVEVPTDLVQIDRSARTGVLFVKTDLSSAVPTTLTIRAGRPTDGAVDAMDIIGRNAVWTNYHRVLMFGADHANRAGSDYPTTNAQNFSLSVAATSPNTGCHQGVCFDGTHYYVSDTNGLKKYDSAWTVVLTNTDPVGDVGLGTNHVGDIDVYDGTIYAPIENYVSISSYSRQRIAKFSALTLEYLGSVSISAQGHEASSIAYCDKDGLLYVSSYSDGGRLWKYDPDTLAFVGTLTLSASISMIQGVTWWGGAFWVNSGSTKSTTRVEYDGTTRNVVWSTSTADDDYEGVGHDDAGLMVLIDSIASSHNGVVKKLSPIAVAPLPGTEMAVGDQFENATGLTRYTTWTMGAHVILGSKATNMGILSYTVDGSSSNADRVTLAYRLSSDRFGLWNDTDSWLLDTASPSVGSVYRLNASHNGTSGRKIYRNGALTNSAGSSTARPSASANVLAVGIESWAKTEDFVGKIGFSYLAPTQFSDAYVAAESSNLFSPGSFYTVTG